MRPTIVFSFSSFATLALGESHYFISSFLAESAIVGVEFDDATSFLSLVNNIMAQATSGSKSLSLVGAVTLSSDRQNANYPTAASASPYTIIAVAYSTECPAQAISIGDLGSLDFVGEQQEGRK
ncbi:hypothetical protein BU25DRAFT_466774 [Macroventuria anomochaeta]|uniref:Uncharacterized protein n=1 Tax=Macroventuria anomochaeta TaxID=301207 RepID=A0ACB6S670_9PLEO|nr:uncharacterized protein BU25DRAFT_466774 [Macroventuria anomochaeta]KAF2628853.1 hypothetical protein BU25DRAFT_466774 [Macroventuria anomochaeta]